MSCAKIAGVLYAAIGLIVGFFISLAALFGAVLGASSGDEPGTAVFGMLFGVGAIVLMPLFYGVLGAVMALISAALYNVVARFVGGIEIDLA